VADDVYNEILGELSIDAQGVGAVGTGAVAGPPSAVPAKAEASSEMDDLEARLNALQ
jgi:hypothetical protein